METSQAQMRTESMMGKKCFDFSMPTNRKTRRRKKKIKHEMLSICENTRSEFPKKKNLKKHIHTQRNSIFIHFSLGVRSEFLSQTLKNR